MAPLAHGAVLAGLIEQGAVVRGRLDGPLSPVRDPLAVALAVGP